MNVGQLINELQKYDPETMVVKAGYEGGFDEIIGVSFIRLILDANPVWCYGSHEETQDPDGHPAIYIG